MAKTGRKKRNKQTIKNQLEALQGWKQQHGLPKARIMKPTLIAFDENWLRTQ